MADRIKLFEKCQYVVYRTGFTFRLLEEYSNGYYNDYREDVGRLCKDHEFFPLFLTKGDNFAVFRLLKFNAEKAKIFEDEKNYLDEVSFDEGFKSGKKDEYLYKFGFSTEDERKFFKTILKELSSLKLNDGIIVFKANDITVGKAINAFEDLKKVGYCKMLGISDIDKIKLPNSENVLICTVDSESG